MGESPVTEAPAPLKLPTLDAGLFVAAFLVALFHCSMTIHDFGGGEPLRMAFRAGHAGVDYFFVLSGFIILYIHRGDLGSPGQLKDFAWKRFVRIVPALWLVLIPWALIRLGSANVQNADPLPVRNALLDLLLIPHGGATTLGVTWTLRCEAIFYIGFAVAIVNRRVGIPLLVAWQLAVLAALPFDIGDPFLQTVFGRHNIGFGAGLLAAAVLRPNKALGSVLLPLGMVLFVAAMAAEWRIGGPIDAEYRPLGAITSPIYTLASVIGLYGAASWDLAVRPRLGRAIGVLGASSYMLYLVHTPFASVGIRIFDKVPLHLGAGIKLLLLAGGSVVTSVVLHLSVERPMLAALRRRVAPGRRARAMAQPRSAVAAD